MDAGLFQRVSALFDATSKLPGAERAAYLDAHCDDAAIRAEVESLLVHADTPAAAMQTHAVNAALSSSLSEIREHEPVQIGNFRILRKLGQGGMGVVYLAEQAHPKREVALKLVRPALTAPDLFRRFEHETQVLARLRHPGIAQLFEAGWADVEGRRMPYFALEYAPGPPLTDYAHRNSLDIRARVELFIRVCDAVQHAHQRGVIHRDLKPANILITEEGREGGSTAAPARLAPRALPKVLDFGVARLTDADVKMTTVQTDVGQLIGTIAYMSPEQIDGDPLAIDTRSDIYTLGVILYELLSGALPHTGSGTSLPERIRVIREVEPPRLSTTNPRLRGDLDTIVHKTLEKAPARRYDSAADLAADLHRYLRNEPILARPPTLRYQIAKFAQRNRALVIGSALAVLALIGGAIGTTWQAIRATREQHRAEAALAESQKQRAIAAGANEFLNDLLTAADLEKAADERDETMGQFLTRAEKRLAGGSLRDRPEVEADVRSTLGMMSKQLGRFEPAIAHMRRCHDLRRELYGQDSPGAIDALANIGDIHLGAGQYDQAEAPLREALALAEARAAQRSSGAAATGNPPELQVATISGDLAQVHSVRGDVAGAIALNHRAIDILLALGAEHDTLRATLLNNLANVHRDAREYAAAEPLYLEALKIVRARVGDRHIRVAIMLNNLGLTIKLQNRFDEALPLYREALAIRRELLPADHPDLAESLHNLATMLGQKGDFAAAAEYADEALSIVKRTLPPGHVRIGYASRALGNMLLRLDRFAEAEPHLLAAYGILKQYPSQPIDHAARTATLLTEMYEKWSSVDATAERAAAAAHWRTLATTQPASAPAPTSVPAAAAPASRSTP